MELTPSEKARIREAWSWEAGSADFVRSVVEDARFARSEVQNLLRAWDKLSDATRAAVEVKLAANATPGLADGEPLAIDPELIDIGAALRTLLADAKNTKINKTREHGFREAVREAAQVWVDRGNAYATPNVHRDTDRYRANPMTEFVIAALFQSIPHEVILGATGARNPSDEQVLSSVATQLR